jgi:ATP-binding cassette subfamily C protein CydD
MRFRPRRIDDAALIEPVRGLTLRTGASRIRLVDRRVLALGRGEGAVIAGLAAIGSAISALFVAQGVLVARSLGLVFDGSDFSVVVPWLVAIAVVLAVRSILVWIYQTRSAAAAGRIAGRLRSRLYRQMTDLGPGWTAGQRSGALQTTLVDGVEQIESYFRLFVAQVVMSFLTVAGVVAALVVIDPWIGSVVGVLVAMAAAGPAISWRFLGTALRHWWTAAPALSAEFVDSMQGASTLKVFGASASRGEDLKERSADVLDANMSLNWVEHAWLQPFSLAGAAAGVSAIWIGIARFDAGAISSISLLLVLLLVGEALRPVAETKRALHFAMQGMGAAEGVLEILDADPDARSGGVVKNFVCGG